MITHRLFRSGFVIIAALSLCAIVANASTIATFSDPAPNGDTPLFELYNTTFSGHWLGTGLNLQVPVTGLTWSDARFTMNDLTVGAAGSLSTGTIEFYKSAALGGGEILRIDFSAASLAPFGFGASSTFVGQDVHFSGPGIPGGLTHEFFAFSFANPDPTEHGFTYTAAFTSSATIPEPSALAMLGLGLCGLIRRR